MPIVSVAAPVTWSMRCCRLQWCWGCGCCRFCCRWRHADGVPSGIGPRPSCLWTSRGGERGESTTKFHAIGDSSPPKTLLKQEGLQQKLTFVARVTSWSLDARPCTDAMCGCTAALYLYLRKRMVLCWAAAEAAAALLFSTCCLLLGLKPCSLRRSRLQLSRAVHLLFKIRCLFRNWQER